jgi:hypothetical protein
MRKFCFGKIYPEIEVLTTFHDIENFEINTSNDSKIINAYNKLCKNILTKVKKYQGTKIDPLKTKIVSNNPDMTLDQVKNLINFNNDYTLNRVLEFAEEYLDSKIDQNGLSIISNEMMIRFISAPKKEQESDKTYGTPDAEDYFAGKRKKPKNESEAKIVFTYKGNQTINRTMEFVDIPNEPIKKVIINHVRKINENNSESVDKFDEELTHLKRRIVKDFKFVEQSITEYLTYIFPKPYDKLFSQYGNFSNYILFTGNSEYKVKISLNSTRLTSPYKIDILKNNESILNKEFIYSSLKEIQK